MKNKLNYLCVGILICLLSTTGLSRTLSLHQMATITGMEADCCSKVTDNTDCNPTDLNTCVSCEHKTEGEPAGCSTSGIKYSGITRQLCDSLGEFLCDDDGKVNCTKNCDCKSSGVVNNKECDKDEKCNNDKTGTDCRDCEEDDCDASWAQKPDETCS